MKRLTKSEYRELILSNLNGLAAVECDNVDHTEQPVIVYKLLLCFDDLSIKTLEYRTESERDNKYNELKLILKKAA
jgi:hypothetical protein